MDIAAYLIHLLAFVVKRNPTVLLGPILAVLEAVVDFECNLDRKSVV